MVVQAVDLIVAQRGEVFDELVILGRVVLVQVLLDVDVLVRPRNGLEDRSNDAGIGLVPVAGVDRMRFLEVDQVAELDLVWELVRKSVDADQIAVRSDDIWSSCHFMKDQGLAKLKKKHQNERVEMNRPLIG